ncbi:non-ribosomal peptide synthetase [Paucibacter sp. APW11]|uniref:Non-ribosomal peptide synthetase n=1 Tax=Roseateles aquae TaxID=3077235 RepID=A0ABU3PAU7_9BURK|nr:non-ribosomal peptide synthetase [Paucibacter sp. APW11]MDT8999693.1 non-ribosomal peptide synthetase [Paucibacter sp. APW11]
MIGRIVDIARTYPNAPAVSMAGRTLSYADLDSASSRLANAIVARGIGVGDLVGIAVERSVELIIAILGVLKTGAAYAAIDPEYPPERVAQMCAAVDMALVLTTEKGLGTRPPFGAPRLHLDRDRERIAAFADTFELPELSPNDLVYVVFTSGSTGTPKAAAVHQAGWMNLMSWFVDEFKISPQDRALIVSSFSFDITQRAIVMPLLAGGQLHLCPFPTIDAAAVLDQIRRDEISLLNCAPSAFYPLAESPERAAAGRLRCLFLGGEPINAARLQAWAEASTTTTRVANVYGTAECSDVSTFHVLSDYKRYIEQGVPAGHVITNTRVHLLDDSGRPVSPGEVGEIVIAGVGVGKGYVNDLAATRRKFIADPEVPDQIAYRSGDLGRWLPDVGLVFEGRADHQVKIRGNRVDLGDVESLLRQDVRLRDAVAVKLEAGNAETLAAMLLVDGLPADAEMLAAEVRKALARRAPVFMIPTHIEFVTAFPLNPNGKVDRPTIVKAFERVASVQGAVEEKHTSTEQEIARIFSSILNVSSVGLDDNFFDLGGYSMLVTEALAEINSNLDAGVTIYDFLTGPTVRALAERIAHEPATQA